MSETAASADVVAPTDEPAGSSTSSLTQTVDRISLEQALKDFEVANARVLDLTHRLTELNQELLELPESPERLRIEHNRVRPRGAAPRAAAEVVDSPGLRVHRAV